MRILQLTKKVPFTLKDGESIAIFQMAKGLVEEGCQVDILAMNTKKHFVDPESIAAKEGMEHYNSVTIVDLDTDVKISAALYNLIRRKSYNIARFESADYSNHLRQILKKTDYDVILLETLYLTPYIELLKAESKAQISLRSHNIESQIWYDLYTGSAPGLTKRYLKICADRLKEYESQVINSIDSIISISDLDTGYYTCMGYSGPLITVPVGMHISDVISVPSSNIKSTLSAGYIGSMDWKPNIEGLEWFTEKAWPTIQKKFDMEFRLAGRNISEKWNNLQLARFYVAGEVESSEKFIEDLDLVIVPLFSGSGIRVKILEAMAMGKSVASTRKGFEGIDIVHGVNAFVFENVNDLIDSLTQIVEDKTLIKKIGEKARETIVNSFDNSVLASRVVNFFENQKPRNIS